jgi:hypothetical protein
MWKQCITPYPGDFKGIQDKFEIVFMALGAPEEMALFSRTTADRKHEIFLLSPAAAGMAEHLDGEWTDAPDALDHAWGMLVANGDARKLLGVQSVGKG